MERCVHRLEAPIDNDYSSHANVARHEVEDLLPSHVVRDLSFRVCFNHVELPVRDRAKWRPHQLGIHRPNVYFHPLLRFVRCVFHPHFNFGRVPYFPLSLQHDRRAQVFLQRVLQRQSFLSQHGVRGTWGVRSRWGLSRALGVFFEFAACWVQE